MFLRGCQHNNFIWYLLLIGAAIYTWCKLLYAISNYDDLFSVETFVIASFEDENCFMTLKLFYDITLLDLMLADVRYLYFHLLY